MDGDLDFVLRIMRQKEITVTLSSVVTGAYKDILDTFVIDATA